VTMSADRPSTDRPSTDRPSTHRLSPRAVRIADFSHRRRGLDQDEVRRFLDTVADQLESADAERARLRAENDDLRRRLDTTADAEAAVNPRAIALFSQAQQVADNLVAEAVEHARELMKDTRKQQRELLEKARHTGVAPARRPGAEVSAAVPEVEYVRTFAKVAQVQLRSVLEALTEQVDRLSDVSRPGQPGAQVSSDMLRAASGALLEPVSGPVHWRFDRAAEPPASSEDARTIERRSS